jgi:hypothetical protein
LQPFNACWRRQGVVEKLYTVREAAKVYFQGKVSISGIYRLFNRGGLTGFRAGGKLLLYESGLDAYREAHENTGPPGPGQMPSAKPGPLPQALGGTLHARLRRLPDADPKSKRR